MKKLINTVILCVIFYSGFTQNKNDVLHSFLNHKDLINAGIGIQIIDHNNNVVLSHHPELNLIPASTLKILTTISALEYLSVDFTYKTQVFYSDKIEVDGTLRGDLVIYASGDPTLCSEYLGDYTLDSFCENIYQSLLKSNIKCIDGYLTLSSRASIRPAIEATWLWQDIANYYAGGARPFNILDNSYKLTFNTDGDLGTQPKLISIDPVIPKLSFDNKIKIAGAKSGDQSYIYGGPDQYKKSIEGTLPKRKKAFTIKGAIHHPDIFILDYLRKYLAERKIIILKTKSSTGIEKTAPTPLCSFDSPPLSEIIKAINEKSVNLYAEALLNQVILQTSASSAQEAIDHLAEKWDIDQTGYIIKDGSGLSVRNSISADALTAFLHRATLKPWFNVLIESLAEAGSEGTLKNMFHSKQKQTQIFAKSGSMSAVRCYAGYMYNEDRHQYSFAIMINNYKMNDSKLKKRIEKLILGVVE